MTTSIQINTLEMLKGPNYQIVRQQTPMIETLSQDLDNNHSVDSYIADQSPSRSAIPQKCSSAHILKALFITIVWKSLLQLTTCSVSTTLTFGYNNPQILTGKITLSTDTLTPSAYASVLLQMSYDISINIPTNYSTYIGIHALSVQNISPLNNYTCHIYHDHDFETVLRVNAVYDDDLIFHYVGINYISIEPNYFSAAVQHIGRNPAFRGQELNSSNPAIQNFGLSNIESGKTYKAIKLLTYIYIYAIDSAIVGNMFYTVNLDIQNSNLEHVTEGNNIPFVYDSIQVLVFLLDTTQRTRLQFHTVQASTSGDRLMPIVTGLQINEENTIIGLMGFTFTNTNIDFNFQYNNGEIWLQNSVDSPTMKADIALVYTLSIQCRSSFYQSDIDGTCKKCLDGCFRCFNISVCQECFANFTLQNADTECNCQFSTVSDICYDFENSPMKGCESAEIEPSSNSVICLRCSEIENLILDYNECVCKEGYERTENTANCSEICGDSLIFNAECDDGNTIDNDGCSSKCFLETELEGFVCDSSNGSTVCKSQEPLSLSVTKIWKNSDNSATFTVSSNSIQSLPFDFEMSQFEGSQMLKLTVYSAETNESTVLNTEILSVEGLSIEFLVTFEFTIQNLQSQLWLNTSLTKYTAAQKSIQFTSKGENKALKVTDFFDVYQPMSHSMLAVGIAAVILLFVGLLTPKFIGLQTMLTLSLVYLSQILIVDPENVPAGFMYLEPLQYALGYKDFVHHTSYSADSTINQKFAYLEFKKSPVENFNSSFVLLISSFLVFIVTVFIRMKKQWSLQKIKDEQQGEVKAQRLVQGIENQADGFEKEREAVSCWTNINEKSLHPVTQLSFWCILQVFSATSAQLNIKSSAVTILQESVLSHFNGLIIAVSLFIIVTVGLTYSFNLYLSFKTLLEMAERPSELLYKKMLFVYLFVMAYLMMFCFWVKLSHFYCSTAVLAVHLIYMGSLIKVHPYQLSLHIHSVGLFSNQVILLVVLLFINALNYFGEFNEVLVLALGFFVVGTCGAVVVIGAVRLYYEYRYGKELQEEIQEERRMRSRKERQRAKKEFNDMQELYRLQARNRMTPLERIRARNQFLVENQFLEDKKEYFWDYLQSKTHLAKEIKEKHYFDIFDQKPLSWLKIHKPKEYKEEMEALQQWRREYHQKQIKKRNDPEFKALHKRLHNEFRRKKKQAKLNRKNHQFRS